MARGGRRVIDGGPSLAGQAVACPQADEGERGGNDTCPHQHQVADRRETPALVEDADGQHRGDYPPSSRVRSETSEAKPGSTGE